MKLKRTAMATALTVLATAAAAQTTETTTTQTQPATTTEPATTTQTTTTESQPASTPDGQPATTTTQATTTETSVTAATADDVKKGVSVYDQSGALVGKVDSVSASGAIVNTGKARAEVPIASFGKNDKGLVVSSTKADIEAQVKAAKPKS